MTLGGRNEVLEDLVDALEIAAIDHRMPPPVMLVGPRGVGKTVLLGELADLAGRRFGWPRVHVEVRPGAPFTDDLLRVDRRRSAPLIEQAGPAEPGCAPSRPPSGPRSPASAARSASPGRRPPAERRPPDAAATALTALARLAIDARHRLRADHRRDAARRPHGAGHASPRCCRPAPARTGRSPPPAPASRSCASPSTRSPTSSGRPGTSSACSTRRSRSMRSRARAAQAGRPLDLDAAERLALEAGGYPYAIQVYGHYAWRASDGAARITLEAADAASARAGRALAQGLYAGRWSAASADPAHVPGHRRPPGRRSDARHRPGRRRPPRADHPPALVGAQRPAQAGHAHRRRRRAPLHDPRHGRVGAGAAAAEPR